MDQRFVPLNALIAFCYPSKTGWPRPLFDAGFSLAALEFPAQSDGGQLVVDAVTWSSGESHFVLGESKSGANIDEPQARKYESVQLTTLVQMLGVTLTSKQASSAQALYVTTDTHIRRVEMGLSTAGVSFPILAVGEETVTHHGADFQSPGLRAAFSSPISVPGPPPGIIAIDIQSPDEEFDRVVQPCLVALLASHQQVASVRKIAEEAIPSLPLYPNGYCKKLVRRVEDAARRAAAAAPENFTFFPRSGANDTASIRVVESPENLDPRGRTQSYQKLGTRFAGTNRRRFVAASNQPSLFDDENYTAELARLDKADEDDVEEGNDGSQ